MTKPRNIKITKTTITHYEGFVTVDYEGLNRSYPILKMDTVKETVELHNSTNRDVIKLTADELIAVGVAIQELLAKEPDIQINASNKPADEK